MVGGTQFSPWQGLRGESGPNWHSTIRVQPLPGTSVPMTHPWYSEVQGQDDVGGRGAAWRGST